MMTARKLRWFLIMAMICAMTFSAGWFLLSWQIENGLIRALEREASAGRQWTCKERALTGFPIAVRLQCTGLKLQANNNYGSQSAQLTAVTAKYNILNPSLIRIEAAGPAKLSQSRFKDGQSDQRQDLMSNWGNLRLDIGLSLMRPRTAILTAQNARITVTRNNALPVDLSISNAHIELDLQRSSSSFHDLRYKATIDKLVSTELDSFVADDTPADIFLSGLLSNFEFLRKSSRSRVQIFEEWSQSGGRLIIDDLAIIKTKFQFATRGEIILDHNGFPEGRLTVGASGVSGLMRRFGVSPGAMAIENMLGNWINKRKKADAASNPDRPAALPLPLILRNGRLYFGPVQTSVRLPRLY